MSTDYEHDVLRTLQRLEQGEISVPEAYYQICGAGQPECTDLEHGGEEVEFFDVE